ncbi:hypothetical protein [Sphingobium fuliginis]|uniref:Spore coat protein U domain-containing protein n=1 Tax=Sphingobium fuliginis (strain ATCC 27551) TaxID=336203 RepID=A0A292ZDL0_SPHSA|nr:hypothetical protein [Sphingobium fuliginis]GAY20996.1 hypothetical protein SFOMI_1526 [Sphingobium fuliginis]
MGARALSAFIFCAVPFGTAQAAEGSRAADNRSVELNVHGKIMEQCAIGNVGDMNFGDITRPGLKASARVSFNCNVPFRVDVRSANGGLANAQFPNGQGPYAGRLPYSIGFQIPVLKPSSSLVAQTFESSDLMGGRSFNSAGGIAVDGMALNVALGRPSSEAGLLAGSYSETIIISVSPS